MLGTSELWSLVLPDAADGANPANAAATTIAAIVQESDAFLLVTDMGKRVYRVDLVNRTAPMAT